MTQQYLPLVNLRDSLEAFIDKPKEAKRFRKAVAALLNMQHSFADYMLTTKDEVLLKRYIRVFQSQIRLVMDIIPNEWMDDFEIPDEFYTGTPTGKRQYVCYECYRLLKELQYSYHAYFDYNVLAPFIYAEIEKIQHGHKWLLVASWMEGKGEHYSLPWTIVENSQKAIWQNSGLFEYNTIEYAWEILNQTLYNIEEYGHKNGKYSLYRQLIYLNFNHLEFAHHLINEIREEVESLILDYEKINRLKEFRTSLVLPIVRNDLIADPGHPSITHILDNWIKLELDQLK